MTLLRGSAARLAWHETACGSLEALRRRLSRFAFVALLSRGGGDWCRTAVLQLPKNETAQGLGHVSSRWGPADLATGRVSPVVCVTLSRFCSEQRTSGVAYRQRPCRVRST